MRDVSLRVTERKEQRVAPFSRAYDCRAVRQDSSQASAIPDHEDSADVVLCKEPVG